MQRLCDDIHHQEPCRSAWRSWGEGHKVQKLWSIFVKLTVWWFFSQGDRPLQLHAGRRPHLVLPGPDFLTTIPDSAQTEYCSTFHFPCVRPSVAGVTSHISHIYKGINAMLIIRGPIKPCIFWIKIILAIFLAKTRPHKTIFFALTNLTIDFDLELSKYKCYIRIVYLVLLCVLSPSNQ